MKTKGKAAPTSIYRNAARIDQLHDSITTGNRDRLNLTVGDRAMNAAASKKLKAKTATWETLLEDSVYLVTDPDSPDPVVVKLFVDLPFHELCGNIIATKLIEKAGPFYVRCLDVGQFTDANANFFIIMEYVPDSAEDIDLGEPIDMYNMFYQVAYATHHLSTASQLQHFDMRFDNIRVKQFSTPKDFFRNGVKSNFLVKIGDWGQCEFIFGETRLVNESVPRDPNFREKWGSFPMQYSNYDFQYFLSTLTPVLDSLHGLSFYYIYNMTMDYMQPISFTSAQDRPETITDKTPAQIITFLKSNVLHTCTLLPELEEEENS